MLWGNTEDAANSVEWATSQVNLSANSDNKAALFNNTTIGGFLNNNTAMNKGVGIFAVDTTEMGVANSSVTEFIVTSPGSGYFGNTTITVSGNATGNAQANATGRISAVNLTLSGNSYTTPPSVTVTDPTAQTINANTALYVESTFDANTDIDDTLEFIAVNSNPFVNNDVVLYTVAAGNTAVDGLTSGNNYYVVAANSTGVKLALTSNGAAIDLTKGATETGHSLTRKTGGFIEIGSNVYQIDDLVSYTTATGNTAITGLANAASYFVVFANSSGMKLSTTIGGSPISVTPGASESGHTFKGQTATAAAVISGAKSAAHAGWVLRTVGTGGRAGRVTEETLVAMGSIASDNEDIIFKDA